METPDEIFELARRLQNRDIDCAGAYSLRAMTMFAFLSVEHIVRLTLAGTNSDSVLSYGHEEIAESLAETIANGSAPYYLRTAHGWWDSLYDYYLLAKSDYSQRLMLENSHQAIGFARRVLELSPWFRA